MANDPASYSIGELGFRAGVATSLLRYYDEIQLLPPVARQGNRRRYDESSLRRLAVIDLLQRSGFSLEEIRDLLSGQHHWREAATTRAAELRARMVENEKMLRMLDHAIDCSADRIDHCPHFQSELDDHAEGLASVRLSRR